MSAPDHSLTPFSLAFSWQGKLQFLDVTPYRLEQSTTVYRVMKGAECWAIFTLKEDMLHVPVRYGQTAALPKSLHNAIGEELKAALEGQAVRKGVTIQFDPMEYERVFEGAA